MTPERWQRITELTEAAAELPPNQRTAFLTEACAVDQALRLEVESLLASDEQCDGFIEAPVFRIAAELIADDHAGSMIGQVVAAYKIIDLLGVGGMGEVYLAEDTRLGRKVALKFLPSYFTSDRTRLRRFEQEARAASALNHPNILTVYEIGGSDSTQFIATEFVEGRTLRQHMEGVQMTLGDKLEVAIQTASALAVAHRAGIVHRDIKPENIMLRPDGYIKVLDFGLAKMTVRDEPRRETGELAGSESTTQSGLVLGTPHYMSPEQALGQTVDCRTDIFSLGAVIYEMLTGRKPFEGETPSHVVVALLEDDPPRVSEISSGIPDDLEIVVNRLLQKDRQARYQTALGLLDDLKAVRDGLDAQGQSIPDFRAEALSARERSRVKRVVNAKAGGVVSYTHRVSVFRHWRSITLGAVTIVAAAAIFYFWPLQHVKAIDSVAILPFENIGSDSNVEYLAHGIAEYLTSSLSRLPGVTVISSTAASRFKPRAAWADARDMRDLGNELKVQAVVIGKIAQEGSRLQVQVELIDVRNNGSLWGEQYDRSATEILGVQEEIARGISEKLGTRLTRTVESQISKRYTESTEAYHLYLRGRYFWNKRTEPDLRRAIALFDEATGIDPQYSLAYAGLADSYQLLTFHGGLSPKEYCPKARAAAERAIEIDDKLAEAHTALAYEKFYCEWDWPGAEVEFKRAIGLNPNYATAHQWYGEYLGLMSRNDESLAEREKAVRLDPLSPIITSELGFAYYYARNYKRAVEEFRKAVELYPDFSPAHSFLACAYEGSGLSDQAIAECQKAIALADDSYLLTQLARANAHAGNRGSAERLLAKMVESSKNRYYPPTLIAMVYAALGHRDEAFEWLYSAYQHRDWALVQLSAAPELDSLRSDPRFADLMRQMNFSQ